MATRRHCSFIFLIQRCHKTVWLPGTRMQNMFYLFTYFFEEWLDIHMCERVKSMDIRHLLVGACAARFSSTTQILQRITPSQDTGTDSLALTADTWTRVCSFQKSTAMEADSDFEKNWLNPVTTTRQNDTSYDVSKEQKSVAVIGAGVSGLCAMKHLLTKQFKPTAFERNSSVGGTWTYSENTVDVFGLPEHSCLHKNLRTNNPKQLLTLQGFPHDKSGGSYIDHTELLKYIKGFSQHNNLADFIKFNTLVQQIFPVRHHDGKVTWIVKYCSLNNPNESSEREFDAVLVCNGHYHKCFIPEVPGMENFTGTAIHSKEYRLPDTYLGKTVLVIGAAFSGLDIAVDIKNHAKEILLSHRDGALQSKIPHNVKKRPVVSHITENGTVVFVDKTEAEVDCIILCTGYIYDFPCLSSDVIQVKDQRVTPLYKHMVHIYHTNLMFIGIPSRMSYFPQILEQARAAAAILEHPDVLPSVEEMIKDSDEDFRQKKEKYNLTEKQAHFLGDGELQWQYNEELASLCGFKKLPTAFHDLASDVSHQRATNFLNFRKRTYQINSESFQIVNG